MKNSIPTSALALTDQAAKLDFAKWFGTGFNPNSAQEKGRVDSGAKDAKGNEIYLNLPIPIKDVKNLFADMPSFMWSRLNPGMDVVNPDCL